MFIIVAGIWPLPESGCAVIEVGTEPGFNNVQLKDPPATEFTNVVTSVATPPHFDWLADKVNCGVGLIVITYCMEGPSHPFLEATTV